tara:strand:+ start:432 stop:617 length:186 start_codon:yes stop_codon:yes gene_type:complete
VATIIYGKSENIAGKYNRIKTFQDIKKALKPERPGFFNKLLQLNRKKTSMPMPDHTHQHWN